MKKGSGWLFLCKSSIFSCMAILTLSLSGCGANTSVSLSGETSETTDDEDNKVVYEAMLYDNQGNNFLNFYGNEFQDRRACSIPGR